MTSLADHPLPKEELSDEDLALKAQQQDQPAAELLVERYYRKVYGYIRRHSPSDAVAEDLTQQTFMQCWRALSHFNPKKRFSSWIFRIGHNLLMDWRRVESRWCNQSVEWWLIQECEHPAPSINTEANDLANATYQAVEQLDEKVRFVIHLHYYQNLSCSEVGEILGITSPAVRYRLHQGLKTLRRILEDHSAPQANPNVKPSSLK